MLPGPVENAKVSDGNRKKSAREISPGCQGKILKLAGWHEFCKGFLLKYTDCCPPAVSLWPGQSTSQYLRTPVNASLAGCVGTRLTKRVREQQMPCYQQQNIYIYIVSSHRTVNVRIVHRYDNVNSLSKFSHHISIHRWTYLFSKMIGNSKPILYHRFAVSSSTP